MITIPAYSFVTTGSIMFTGLVMFVEYGIYSLTFLVGPVVDRVIDKRYLIMISEAGIAACALFLGLMMKGGVLDKYIYLFLVGLIAVFWDFVWTADHVVLPLIVADEELPRANGYTNALGNSHIAAGLAVGGFLFVFLGAYGSMLLYSAALFLASGLTFFVPLVINADQRKLKSGFSSGWKYILSNNRELLWISIIIAFFSFFSNGPILVMAAVYSSLHPAWYSISYSLYYIGAMFSGFLFGRFYPGNRIGKSLMFTYLASGIMITMSGLLSTSPLRDTLPWFTLGFFFSAHTTLNTIYLQASTKKEMLGRTASNLYTFRGLATAAGVVLLPVFMSGFGLVKTYEFTGIVVTISAILIILFLPKITSISAR